MSSSSNAQVADNLLLLAAYSGSLFAGGSLYECLVEHPARLECGVELATREFFPSHRRAAIFQTFLAMTSSMAGIASTFFQNHDQNVVIRIASGLIFFVMPFTLMTIVPTNFQLVAKEGLRARENILARWGQLHMVRTVAGLAGASLLLFSLLKKNQFVFYRV